MQHLINKLLKPMKRQIRQLLTRGLVNMVDASLLMQTLQVEALTGELLDNIEHWQPYGYTSHPQPGAEALLGSLGGNRSHTVAISVADRRFRLKNTAPGEVALFTDEGDVIHFKRGNEIYINTANKLTAVAGNEVDVTSPLVNVTASSKVTFTTPEFELTGNMTIGGTASVVGALSSATSLSDPTGTVQKMRDVYNGHNHGGDSGGTTGTPNQGM